MRKGTVEIKTHKVILKKLLHDKYTEILGAKLNFTRKTYIIKV